MFPQMINNAHRIPAIDGSNPARCHAPALSFLKAPLQIGDRRTGKGELGIVLDLLPLEIDLFPVRIHQGGHLPEIRFDRVDITEWGEFPLFQDAQQIGLESSGGIADLVQ